MTTNVSLVSWVLFQVAEETPMACPVLTQIKPPDQSARNRHTQCCIDKGYQKV